MRRLPALPPAPDRLHRFALWLLIPLLLQPWSAARAEGRVVLIGVDGGSWNLLEPRIAAGELPNLAALLARGVGADLETVEPVISPTVWSSIATGRVPDAHGVRSFAATARDIQVPTVFERLAAQGVRVGLYDYLVTWPPRALPGGFVIPGWLRRDAEVSPKDVWQRAEVEPFVASYAELRENEDYLALSRREVSEKPGRFLALWRAFEPEVAALTFYAVDMTAHRFWHGAHPQDFDPPVEASPAEQRALPDALLGVDRAVGEIVAALDPGDTVIVVSDHGFTSQEPDVRWVSQLQPLLLPAGLLPWRDRFTIVSTFGVVGIGIQGGDFVEQERVYAELYDLLASVVSADGDPLYSVYRLDIAERPEDRERSLYQRFGQWGLGKLLDWRFGVVPDPNAHALIFATPNADVLESLAPDATVKATLKEGDLELRRDALLTPQRFTGGHAPTGIFIAAGGPIAARATRAEVSVLDVAPLLFHLSGRALPDDLEGRLPEELLDAAWLSGHPPRRVGASALPTLPPRPPPEGSEAEEGMTPELRERLRGLGYID